MVGNLDANLEGYFRFSKWYRWIIYKKIKGLLYFSFHNGK